MARALPEDYLIHAGYGQSHGQKCAGLAARARVARIGMFHHAFSRTDAAIEAAKTAAQRVNPAILAAREGMVLRPEPGPAGATVPV